ncbi:MAG: DUF1565 domain-containing protein [Ruminococcaceae bacterium]|nr:DUF1565 domain-containing protein [Oscillospiraceae bacterium]
MANVYHVSKSGNDRNTGTEAFPFLTISKAASLADEGDTVIVHEGVYRESVSPAHGARNEAGRITYMAAEGERAVIKGSEILENWEETDGIWRAEVSNALFGDFNPFADVLDGDWLARPLDYPKHTGCVYINEEALWEASHEAELHEKEMSWFAVTGEETTAVFVHTDGRNPNEACMEINVRRTCFYPEKTGLNYITVRGFEMAQAATPWAPPTAHQIGMLGVHWAKGWIIENNVLHDSRCCAVSVGKELSTGHHMYTRYRRKAGTHYQYEAMLAAKRLGWSRETIGSHIIRNNKIHHCGQNGIVGHLGGVYSEIYGNEIYHIADKGEFWGHEVGAIKLHALIDTQIHHNHIHHCLMGVWMDWQVQGARLSSNLFHHNGIDMKCEVTHGPHLVDNNIFGSEQNFQNAAQGGAYVHNLFFGGMFQYAVLDRSTPYHLAHSTEMKGCSLVYGGDDRYYNNIFLNTQSEENKRFRVGLSMFNGAPDTLEEYLETVWNKFGKCDALQFGSVPQPIYTAHNYYGDGAPAYDRDLTSVSVDTESFAKIETEENGDVYLSLYLDERFDSLRPLPVDSLRLDMPRIAEEPYENPDGSPLCVDRDFFGNLRGEHPKTGPLENLKAGKNRILLTMQN